MQCVVPATYPKYALNTQLEGNKKNVKEGVPDKGAWGVTLSTPLIAKKYSSAKVCAASS